MSIQKQNLENRTLKKHKEFGKGMMNKSGQRLLKTCMKGNLFISKTFLNVKRRYRTTWTASLREYVGSERR